MGSRPWNIDLSLDFYSVHRYGTRRWFDGSWMSDKGNLPHPQLLAALRGCSWGLVTMALSDEDPRYNRYSFPTKLIAYLAAGLPVVTLGHPESSVMRLSPVLADPRPRGTYRAEMIRCAEIEFDAGRMRTALRAALCGRSSCVSAEKRDAAF